MADVVRRFEGCDRWRRPSGATVGQAVACCLVAAIGGCVHLKSRARGASPRGVSRSRSASRPCRPGGVRARCSPGHGRSGGAETTTTLTVEGTDGIAFEPDAFSVPAGEAVTVELTSGPAVLHDLVIAEAGATATTSDTGEPVGPIGDDDVFVVVAEAGETATASFRVDEPGSNELYCSMGTGRFWKVETVQTWLTAPGRRRGAAGHRALR